MSIRQAVAAVGMLAVAVVLQPTVVGLLHLPLGGPALPTIVLACLAMQTGPTSGCLLGFTTGLAADLISDHVIGRLAMVLCLVGYLAGLLRMEAKRSIVVPLADVAVAGALAALLFAATGTLVGDSRAGGATLVQAVVASVVYAVVLTPFVFPGIRRGLRRLARRPTSEQP